MTNSHAALVTRSTADRARRGSAITASWSEMVPRTVSQHLPAGAARAPPTSDHLPEPHPSANTGHLARPAPPHTFGSLPPAISGVTRCHGSHLAPTLETRAPRASSLWIGQL